MIETYAKIRSIINFIEEELLKVPGSDSVKKEIADVCGEISSYLSQIGEVEDSKIVANIKDGLDKLDDIVDKIERDETNHTLFMLLICHIPGIRFMFLSKEDQEKFLKH